MRARYARAGQPDKSRLITEVVELLGYHRKAAIRALQPMAPPAARAPAVLGRPRHYDPQQLLAPLKTIWRALAPALRQAPGRGFARMGPGV